MNQRSILVIAPTVQNTPEYWSCLYDMDRSVYLGQLIERLASKINTELSHVH